jgi:hypothetical protein
LDDGTLGLRAAIVMFGLTAGIWRGLHIAVLTMSLAACGGGGSSSAPASASAPVPTLPSTPTYTVGGMVSGLVGSGLVLQINGSAGSPVSAAGAFTFPDDLSSGAAYSVTVAMQPLTPTQNCVVTNGTGTVSVANVTDVEVDCAPAQLTLLANQPPERVYLSLLLTDGSVMMQSINDASVFYKLTPDSAGSFANGTWRRLSSPPPGYAPYAGAQAVLADGRVLFVGGEYNQNQYVLPFAPSGLTNMSAIYDPTADSWMMIAAPPGVPYIGDVSAALLADGGFVFGDKLGRDMWRLDPVTLTWSSLPALGKADNFAEEGWTVLPDGNLFTIDVGNPGHAEHYDPVAGQWYSDGVTPDLLSSPTATPGGLTYGPASLEVVGGVTYGPGPTGTYLPPGEIGPALLLPNGTVFATGAAAGGAPAHTAIYTPGLSPVDSGSFAAGPDFAVGDDAGDSSAALMPSGHVLIAVGSGRFYEYTGASMSVTGALPNNAQYFVLPLPSGQILVTGGVTALYTGYGSSDTAWVPTITAAPAIIQRGTTYTISGTQFNGLSQAAAFGDELNVATNYPLVRLTNVASGHVVYARTHDHSTMAVATGSKIVSTSFDVPPAAESGASSLVVVANGIASAPAGVTVN